MPKKSVLAKAQYIAKFWMNPCNAPLVVYIETFLPEFELALIEYFTPTIMDFWRGFFRPKQALRAGRHGTSRRKKKGKINLPDIGEEIGSRLPGSGRLHERQISDGVRHLWIIYGEIERVLWYVMVIGLAFQTIYKWTTAMKKTAFCQMKHYARCLNQKPLLICILGGQYQGCGFGDQIYSDPQDFGYSWALSDSGGTANCVLAGTMSDYDPANPTEGAMLCLLRTSPGFPDQVFVSGPGRQTPDGHQQIVAATGIPLDGGSIAACMYRTGGGFAKFTDVSFTAWQGDG